MPTIYIDNQAHEVPEGERNLLETCLSLGYDLPYFCWHPAMHSVGACRQCAVKVFKDASDARGRIVMSCITPVRDGMRISITDPEAAAMRGRVIEWLMLNHPHDCPVCDEGGECHLQDMTVMTGHVYRRYRFTKRTHRDQDLGPFVNMEMNRCIQCYRCVRFYRDYAGGRDFGVMGWHDHVYFGRHESGKLQSEFSGNLVEVCPTGVFTDKTLKKHYTRKWDLQVSPSVCVHCGLGCNVIPGERYGKLRRVRARFSEKVNGYFLCDRGRYGYEFTNSTHRIRSAMVRGDDGVLCPANEQGALAAIAKTQAGGKGRMIGIASGRASLESNFALRSLVGADRFFQCVSRRELELADLILQILRDGPCRTPSLREVETADAVFVLGEDLTNTAPMLDLAIRQAVRRRPEAEAKTLRIPSWDDGPTRLVIQQDRGPLFIAAPCRTKLDEIAGATYHAAPDDLARLGFAVAHEIDPAAPAVEGLPDATKELAARIAGELRASPKPLIVSGPGCGNAAVIRAAANVALALKRAGRPAEICFTAPECNAMGLALLGGEPIESAIEALKDGKADTVIILECDLYRHLPAEAAEAILKAAANVIVIDHTISPTVEKASVVLPAAAFGESDGTFINSEGRAQRFYKTFVPAGPIKDSWRWMGDLSAAAQAEPGCALDIDTIHIEIAMAIPVFTPILQVAPPAGFRMAGQRVPRQPHRYSGRTAVSANVSVHEPKPSQDADAPLSFSMEGYSLQPPAALLANYWSPGWNSVQSINKFQIEVGGSIKLAASGSIGPAASGSIHGGEPGRRLIDPPADSGAAAAYFADVPAPFAPREGQWLAVPAHHIFGSEELSIHSPAIRQLVPRPYVAINFEDARRAGMAGAAEVTLIIGGASRPVALAALPDVPAGMAAVPVGLPELAGIELPAWATIRRNEQ